MGNSKRKKYFFIFLASAIVHLFLYLSAHFTYSLDIFFDHVTLGQDFFQVPNGAYAFIRGGDLKGYMPQGLPRYTDCCGINDNVYHPVFTLTVGTILQLFKPWKAFAIWIMVHMIFTVLTVLFIWNKLKNQSLVFLALSLFLLNSYHYYEIQHAQYHFLFNFFTFLFLYYAYEKEDSFIAGLWFFLSLMVKPIGLLWLLPLFLYKRFKILITAVLLFVIFTLPFYFIPEGKYYFTNLIGASKTIHANYNLMTVMHFIPSLAAGFSYIRITAAVGLLVYQIIYKPSIFKIVTLWIFFQLLFYSGVYHYHYTIIPYLVALGILLKEIRLSPGVFITIILLTLPTPIVFFRVFGVPSILPTKVAAVIAFWSASLIALLSILLMRQKRNFIRRNNEYPSSGFF